MAKTDIKTNLKSYDDLFKSSEQRTQEEKQEEVKNTPDLLPVSILKPFSKHPFKMYDDEKMARLADSIKEQGIIVPILVRPIKDKKFEYEIIAGHNRVQAARMAGIDNIPCNIRDLDDATATILMVDSNLQQRDTILPSEKAFAYKYKLEAIKSQGKRNDLTSRQLVGKLEVADAVGKESNESGRQIQRYIRLTNLISPLLDTVDERKLSFIPAVDLSYLQVEEQEWLYDILCREEKFAVPLAQAQKLKGISQNGKLTYEKIDKIIIERNLEPPKAIKLSYKAIKEFFPPSTTPKEYEITIQNALKEWFENHPTKNLVRNNEIQR